MPSPLLAKMSAALHCCEELYAVGELTPDLEPVGKDKQLQLLLAPSDERVENEEEKAAGKEKEMEAKEESEELKEESSEQNGTARDAEDECGEGLVSVKRRQFYYKKVRCLFYSEFLFEVLIFFSFQIL